jgi:hypothetical protein
VVVAGAMVFLQLLVVVVAVQVVLFFTQHFQ